MKKKDWRFPIIADVVLKLFLGLGAMLLLSFIVYALLKEQNAYNKATYALLGSVIVQCLYLPFKHYFNKSQDSEGE